MCRNGWPGQICPSRLRRDSSGGAPKKLEGGIWALVMGCFPLPSAPGGRPADVGPSAGQVCSVFCHECAAEVQQKRSRFKIGGLGVGN